MYLFVFVQCACVYAYVWLCVIIHFYFLNCREYINEHVVDFAKENPQCAVYVRFRPGRAPRLIGEYCKSNVVNIIAATCAS